MPETNSTRLDPAVLESCRDVFGRYFPWDTTRALELALLKTFCIPSISSLLHQTGEFEHRLAHWPSRVTFVWIILMSISQP